jgi:hypothetical protein
MGCHVKLIVMSKLKSEAKFSTVSLGSFCSHSHKISTGDHLCEFYKSTEDLIHSLSDFVVPGITRGEGIILIATQLHTKKLIEALENRDIDVAMATARGQLVIFDAHATLSKFMVNDLPEPNKFNKLINTTLLTMQGKFPRIRAYGEMVDILVKQNNVEATIELENLWNEICSKNSLSLLCGYSTDFFTKDNQAVHKKICNTHNHLVTNGQLQRI